MSLLLMSSRFGGPPPSQGGGSEPGEWVGKTAHAVGQSATGNGSGSDWDNQMAMPATLQRDHVYYIADGSYGSYTFDDALSTTLKIYVVKATEADHGPVGGWVSTYGDGVATWNTMTMTRGYYYITGSTRTETNRMEAPAGYGFRLTGEVRASTGDSQQADGSIFEYLDVGETWSTSAHPSNSACVYLVFSQSNITFRRCCFHNAGHNGALAMLHGSDGVEFYHCDFYHGWGKEAIAAPNVGIDNLIVAFCRFWNSTQFDSDVEGGGITAEIGAFGNDVFVSGCEIYGSIFYNTHSSGRNSVIAFSGLGFSNTSATNCKAYNNTFAGIPEDSVYTEIYFYQGSGNEAKNNLFHDCAASGITANTASNNVTEVSDPFVDYANLDFRLAASLGGGVDLGSPYDVDPLGNSRGATPDVGAYAYV